jgi:hypothetical protein
MNQDLACNLIRTLQRDARSPALKLGDGTVTYAQLDDATVRIAGLLRQRGVAAGIKGSAGIHRKLRVNLRSGGGAA